jgi:putative transposase
MPRDLRRYQESGQSHFVTFSCYRRQPFFDHPTRFQLFVLCLEEMRRRFELCVYAYVVMPEHVHLLLSEPEAVLLAEALHFLKLSFTKRSRNLPTGESGSFWQKRYYDRNVRDHHEFMEKLGYIHRNPVKRGLVASPEQWKWSSYRHYALRETGVVEIESEWTARDREKNLVGGPDRIFLNPG